MTARTYGEGCFELSSIQPPMTISVQELAVGFQCEETAVGFRLTMGQGFSNA